MIITYLMEDKKKAYQQHIAAWKNFVLNYCSYQGSEFVCLNDLYKAKNKSVQQDYKNYEWWFDNIR